MQSMQTQTVADQISREKKKHSTTGGRCLDLILVERSTPAVHPSAIAAVRDSEANESVPTVLRAYLMTPALEELGHHGGTTRGLGYSLCMHSPAPDPFYIV